MAEKKKLTVNLSAELVDVLRGMADQHDNSLTDELRRAIEDRKYFSDKVAAGNEVVLLNDATPGVRTVVDLRLKTR